MPRDYLNEASDIIFGNKVSLTQLVEVNHHQVVGNLLGVLEKAHDPMTRKAAVYALGQIGEPRSMNRLRKVHDIEGADGARDAMVASMTAIKLAPMPTHSQLERQQIIDDVYHNRQPADWT